MRRKDKAFWLRSAERGMMLLSLVSLLIVVSISVAIAQTDLQSISSSKMSYTVHYPKTGWAAKLDFYQENFPEYVVVERALLWNEFGAEIGIDVWKDASGVDISQWIDNHSSIFVFTSQELEKTAASVEKLPALRYTVSSENCEAYASKETYFKKGDYVFRVSYLEIDKGVSTETYQQIVDTFEFTVTSQTAQFSLSGTTTIIPKVSGDNTCGGQTHCASCCSKANSLAICCSNSKLGTNHGNCVWWAWQQACRVWGDGVPQAGNGGTWAKAMKSYGYPVSSTPAPNTIACWSGYTQYGHVAWVKEVRGDKVLVSEMGCNSWFGVRDHEYLISKFNEGYIYPKGQIPDGACACNGSDPVLNCTIASGQTLNCTGRNSITLKEGFHAQQGSAVTLKP